MFISFEGTEGVGKSTLIEKVRVHFEQLGHEVVLTREPGGTPLAEKIRDLLLTVNSNENMCPDTELLLIYAARSQHLSQVIFPALAQGKIVLSDRFCDASFAYQVMGRGLDADKLDLLNRNFVPCLPDMTFWLDAPIELGMARALARGELDRFEQEKFDFFSRVREGYKLLHEKDTDRVIRLDATQSAENVFNQALSSLKSI
ncbi:dTMP kinase [Acinetobacter brisouii]|uniref:dTMP kinase n=1 Tax=Acinetobacter brisouii TaxID=396323 RepID=UPI00124FDC24|nr:dTMP kinase [Acinetobacter brisouii]